MCKNYLTSGNLSNLSFLSGAEQLISRTPLLVPFGRLALPN